MVSGGKCKNSPCEKPCGGVKLGHVICNIAIMKKLIIAIILVAVVFAAGLFIGWRVNKNAVDKKISSQAILESLRERGFLVTQTNTVNQSVKIAVKQETFWDRLLWGQVITAYGVVEVNSGVDLDKLKEENVKISGDKVLVEISKVEIFNSRLVGDISLENKQGILKRVFESDSGYNQAMTELVKKAEESIASPQQQEAASAKAIQEITRLVGYIVKDKTVEVVIK